MYEALTIGGRSVPEASVRPELLDGPSKSLVWKGSQDSAVVTDAVPTLEEDEVFGPRRRTNFEEAALRGAAVEEEAVVARDGAEVESDPPLDEEDLAALEGA
jgi:hypothetical protein